MRCGRKLVVAALAIAVATGCVPQTPDRDTYRDRTRQAITQTNSAVQTTRLVLQQLRRDKVFGQYAEVVIRDGEQNLTSESEGYDALDPPPSMDGLHTSTSSLMSDAASAINDARIAVKRGDEEQYSSIIDDLGTLSTKLDKKLGKVR